MNWSIIRQSPATGLNPATARAPSQTPATSAVMTSRKSSANRMARSGGRRENHPAVRVGSSSTDSSPASTFRGSWSGPATMAVTWTLSYPDTDPEATSAPVASVTRHGVSPGDRGARTQNEKGTSFRTTSGTSPTSCVAAGRGRIRTRSGARKARRLWFIGAGLVESGQEIRVTMGVGPRDVKQRSGGAGLDAQAR